MQPMPANRPDDIANSALDEDLLMRLAAESASSISNPHLRQVYSQMFDVQMQHYHLLTNGVYQQ